MAEGAGSGNAADTFCQTALSWIRANGTIVPVSDRLACRCYCIGGGFILKAGLGC